jgi:hypothetical protein
MKEVMTPYRAAALLLLALGIVTFGTGVHFLFFRPAMLPEDVRFTGVDPLLLRPEMLDWLRIVFRTWGGFLAGFGLLLASVAGFMLTSRLAVLKLGTSVAILIAFSRFLFSNVLIGSDYIALVGALFAGALVVASLNFRRI